MSKDVNFKKISTHEEPEKSPGFLLWHISTSWRRSIEQVLKPFNLTHPQFVVLAASGWLTRNGDLVTQSAVGKMACFDPNTTSQIIKGLEQKKFLKRMQSPDGRVKNPFLTQIGAEVLSKALPNVESADHHFFNTLSNKEMESLVTIFQKLANK